MSGSTNASLPARLLAFSAQWEREGNAPETVAILREAAAALSGRVPEGDMARALEWLRGFGWVVPDTVKSAIEEAIAAYDPERAGARSGKVTTLQPGDGWRPIAEAPKDGSMVLLTDGKYVDAGFYHDGSECYGHRGEAGFFAESDRGSLLTASNFHATHWMPLPAAPSAKGV